MDVIRITPDAEDERGTIADILRQEVIDSVTLITSRKGALRGNHYHKETIQYVYVMKGRLKALSQMPGEPARGRPRRSRLPPISPTGAKSSTCWTLRASASS